MAGPHRPSLPGACLLARCHGAGCKEVCKRYGAHPVCDASGLFYLNMCTAFCDGRAPGELSSTYCISG